MPSPAMLYMVAKTHAFESRPALITQHKVQSETEFPPTVRVTVINEIHKTKLNPQNGTHLFQRLSCNCLGVQNWIQIWI